jgi:hypothetical protein
MLQHDLYPIHRLPPKIRRSVLQEFEGRCPTVLDVACIPDTDWLKTPDIGPGALALLRSLTPGIRRQVGIPSLAGLSDADLLAQSKSLQKELSRIQNDLKAHRAELQVRGLPAQRFHTRAKEY